jgi:hypothetical protein
MKKRTKIIYWIATGWLSLGLFSTGLVQLFGMEDELANFLNLGYPVYVMTIVGTWKLLGAIVLLVPRVPLLKEWAYAGVFFAMTGAIISQLVIHHAIETFFGPSLLLLLTVISWYYRPADRTLVSLKISQAEQ